MKRITKIICALVAAIILISAFSGCTKKEVLTGDTYTYWTMLDENMAQTMQSASMENSKMTFFLDVNLDVL